MTSPHGQPLLNQVGLQLLSFVFPRPGVHLRGNGSCSGPDGVIMPEDIVAEENRFKFALLSTTLFLFLVYDFLLLFFLCPALDDPSISFVPPSLESSSTSSSSLSLLAPPSLFPTPHSPPRPTSAAFFRWCIIACVAFNTGLLVLLYIGRHIAITAYCVFVYVNGGVWVVCVVCGPVTEFLVCLVHVPMLAFYMFGHNAGVAVLGLTLAQSVFYSLGCLSEIFPTSGHTLELGITAQMVAVMGSFVLLGLTTCLNERARLHALRKYTETNKRLSKATKTKAQFLANVSHELRTPLHGIVAAGEELQEQFEENVGLPASKDMVGIVAECSRHMLSLINDVLDFERLGANQMKVEYIPFDISDELRKMTKMLMPMVKQKKVELHQVVNVENQRRMGDPLRFRQIVFNLASNALKFTPEGGTVTVTVYEGKQCPPAENNRGEPVPGSESRSQVIQDCATDEVTVEVSDTGIGIPEELLPGLFKSFKQANAETARKFGGSGLGLAICKRLSRLMGGKIGARSQSNVGSTFWFSLPLPLANGESPPPTQQLSISGEAKARSVDALRGVRALLVEDNQFNQKIGIQMLTRTGCSVVVADNGEQCLRMIEEQGPFDVVLMDCHMPVMDGLEATRRIRAKEKTNNEHRVPIIALTASTTPEDKAQCTQAGMDEWLGKPFDRALLAATIRRHVQLPSAPDTPPSSARPSLA